MTLDLTDLKTRKVSELVDLARNLRIDNAASLKKQELIFEILRNQPANQTARGEGVLEILPDGFGFLRAPDCNYLPGPDDIYVSPSQVRRFNLRTGDSVTGVIRAPKEGERYFALIKVESVNSRSPDAERDKLLFDNLTTVLPSRPLPVELDDGAWSARLVDLFVPLGFGQRTLVRAAPRAGRTWLLRELAGALRQRHPEVPLLILLIDERPEEVTEMQRATDAEVLSSTFDEPPTRHVQVADMGLERAKRMVEQGKDVIVMLDSLTRLARACNATAVAGGKMLGGVIDAGAVHRVRRAFAGGRALEEGCSLTMIATLLEHTGARIDEIVAEEMQGTANAELVLRRELAEAGHFPALDLRQCWSAHERHMSAEARARGMALRRLLPEDPVESLLRAQGWLRRFSTNTAVLDACENGLLDSAV